MPEEDPLQALVALELVFEAEGVFLVGELKEVWREVKGEISTSSELKYWAVDLLHTQ